MSRDPHPSDDFLQEDLPVEPVETLTASDLLLILGEPGSGKSTMARDLAGAGIGTGTTLIDLREFSDGTIVDGLKAALDHTTTDLLILDSADEWAGSMAKLVGILKLHILPLVQKRELRLIATCRTGDLHPSLLSLFRVARMAIHGPLPDGDDEDSFIRHLLPLRRTDAAMYVESVGLDASVLLDRLISMGASGLASNIGLLDLLCRTTVADSSVLNSRTALFDRTVDRAIALSPKADEQVNYLEIARLGKIAECAAAMTLFRGAAGVSAGDVASANQVTFEDLVRGVSTTSSPVDDVRLVLDSPLFSQMGAHTRSYSHKSIASYLAARFLIVHDFADLQVGALILTPDEPGVNAAIVPQFQELCTWLLALDAPRFGWILTRDPYSIARHAGILESDSLRALVVEGLLNDANEISMRLSRDVNFAGLHHPTIGNQLLDGLTGTEAQILVALKIIRDRFISGFDDSLLDIALSPSPSFLARITACRILAENGRAQLLRANEEQLLSLDLNHEIRGLMIDSLWPSSWTAADLVQRLRPRNESYFGSYDLVLARLSSESDGKDLTTILDWAVHVSRSAPYDLAVVKLARRLADDAVKRLSLDALNGIGGSAFDVVWWNIRAHKPLQHKLLSTDQSVLMTFLEGFVAAQPASGENLMWLASAVDLDQVSLLATAPIAWLRDKAADEASEESLAWTRLLRGRLDPSQPDALEIAWQFREHPHWDVFSSWFDPIPIVGGEADTMKEIAAMDAEHEAYLLAEQEQEQAQSVAADVKAALEVSEQDPEQFWKLVLALDAGGFEIGTDLLRCGGLQLVDEDLDDRVLGAARAYLNWIAENPLPTFDPAVNSRLLHGASRAATTLLRHAPQSVQDISIDSWRALCVPLLTTNHYLANVEVEATLVRKAIELANDVVHDSLVVAFEYLLPLYEGIGERFWGIDLVSQLAGKGWSQTVDSHLASVSDHNFEHLLRWGVRLDTPSVAVLCEEIIRDSTDSKRIAIVIASLADDMPDEAGLAFLKIHERSSGLARDVALTLAPMGRWQGAVLAGEPSQIADVYCALRAMFPVESDPKHQGVHIVGPDEEARELRDSLLRDLVDTSTPQSLQAIRQIRTDHGEWDLDWAWARARQNFHSTSWSPVEVHELRALVADDGGRLVRTASELRSVVLESLEELQEWLSGEIPQAFALWNVTSLPGAAKDENTISDWYCHGLRLLLNGRNIVVNREVEITRVQGAGMGSRNDVRVDATTDSGTLSVVIEVKRCMNSDLRSGLQNQLDIRYLRDMGLTHGVYLVICFPFDQLVTNSTRAKHSLDGLAQRIHSYSGALVSDIAVIIHDAHLPV